MRDSSYVNHTHKNFTDFLEITEQQLLDLELEISTVESRARRSVRVAGTRVGGNEVDMRRA